MKYKTFREVIELCCKACVVLGNDERLDEYLYGLLYIISNSINFQTAYNLERYSEDFTYIQIDYDSFSISLNEETFYNSFSISPIPEDIRKILDFKLVHKN